MPTSSLQQLADRLASRPQANTSISPLEALKQRLSQIPSSAVLAAVVPQPPTLPLLPAVTAVGLRPTTSTLRAAQVLSLVVRFSEPITVSGRPALALALQSGSASATYFAGSGTNQLTFLYVVQPGDQAQTLQLLPQAPLQLQGGRILSAASGQPVQLSSSGAALSSALGSIATLSINGGPDPALAVLDGWNRVLLDGIGKAALSPAMASRALALLNAACFDCVNAARGSGFSGYALNAQPGLWRGADLSTAFAQVASSVFTEVFSGTSQATAVATTVAAALSGRPPGAAADLGQSLGRQVADLYTVLRADDRNHLGTAGYAPPPPAAASQTPAGVYVATADGFPKGPSLPDWGQVTPWMRETLLVSKPGTTPPGSSAAIPSAPSLDSAAYALDFLEVKELGSSASPTRTAEQSEIAQFWANGPKTETPPGHWQEIVTTVARQKGLTLLDTSRLYAAVSLALADAAIAAWRVKYDDPLWRPVTAIQQADRDGNPLTTGDPSWTPFITTPPFPTFPSGHSTFSAAAAAAADALVGSVQPFTVMGGDDRTIQRQFSSLWQAAEESGRSRIYGGLHFNFDNLTGLAMGQAIGTNVVDQVLMAQVWLGDEGVSYRHDPLNPSSAARAVQGGLGDDLIIGAADQGNRLFGGPGSDGLQGGARADWLDGGEGLDLLSGLGGRDVLIAGGGGARLQGSGGAEAGEIDRLTCGSGTDTVVLSQVNRLGLNYTPADSYAVIDGFDPLIDRIELSANDFAASSYRFQSLGPAAASPGPGPGSSWLYRGADALACFAGVDLSRWGLNASAGLLDPARPASVVLLA